MDIDLAGIRNTDVSWPIFFIKAFLWRHPMIRTRQSLILAVRSLNSTNQVVVFR